MKLLILLTALCLPLSAQDQPQRKITLDFVAFGEDIAGLAITSGGKEIPVNALGFRYSQEVIYSDPAILELSQGADAKKVEPIDLGKQPDSSVLLPPPTPKNGESQGNLPLALKKAREENANVVSLIPLPDGSDHATVLLAPGSDKTFIANVIDDNPSTLPAGKIRIHNYSKIKPFFLPQWGNL